MKNLSEKLKVIISKYREIEKKLLNQDKLDTNTLIKLNKEYSELTPLVKRIIDFQDCEKNIKDLNDLQDDDDISIRNEAEKELKQINSQLKIIEFDLLKLLVP